MQDVRRDDEVVAARGEFDIPDVRPMHEQPRVTLCSSEFSDMGIGIDRVDGESGRQQVARGAQRPGAMSRALPADRPSIKTASTTSAFGA